MPFGLFGQMIGSFADAITGSRNRKFQQEENAKDRQFNAEQAQIQRDWQERMYNDYESPSAQVTQQLKAGLNPFASGVSSQSVGSGSTASAGSSSLPPSPMIGNYLAQAPMEMLNLAEKREDIKSKRLDNQLKSKTFDAAVQQASELLNSSKLSNEEKQYYNKLLRDAYFNEDGTIKDNPNVVSLDISKAQRAIAKNEQKRKEFETFIRDIFGLDYSTLPQSLQMAVSRTFLDITAGTDTPESARNYIDSQINEHYKLLMQKNRKEAYEFLNLVDELEHGIDRAYSIYDRFRDSAIVQIFLSHIFGE